MGLYSKFSEINGKHPWRDVGEEGYVDYPARYRDGGRVVYFNYPLAKELGLIPKKHEKKLNPDLEQAILRTFSLQIINEYDQSRGIKIPEDQQLPGMYMATRYLQLQHKSRQGKTSGDGRSIWNGFLKTGTITFDISSRGTGATQLSPGAQETDKPVKTGNNVLGYASGLADLEEMLGSAVMSEIFYLRGVPTERCLAVIGYKDGSAIGVRTAPNLIRPAHLFRFLKMGLRNELKKGFGQFLDRQEKNKFWSLPTSGKERIRASVRLLAQTYGRMSATLEEEYIFTWLAWDGDNILASGGILDYGSIRQFAAKHNQYRYEDVDRFSTTLTEQRYWAKQMIQVFAQIEDFVLTGEKKNLKDFEEHDALEIFDVYYGKERDLRMLQRIGFTEEQCNLLLEAHRDSVLEFREALSYWENLKTSRGKEEVEDGVNHKPVFLIRNLLRELPAWLIENLDEPDAIPDTESFCGWMAASYASKDDLTVNSNREKKVNEFLKRYRRLLELGGKNYKSTLKTVQSRSDVINLEQRATGDGLVWIINEAVNLKDKIPQSELQDALDVFIQSQVLVPGKWKPIPKEMYKGPSFRARFLRSTLENLDLYKETI